MKNVAESFTLVKLLAKRLNATRWNPGFFFPLSFSFFSFPSSIDDTSEVVVLFLRIGEKRRREEIMAFQF